MLAAADPAVARVVAIDRRPVVGVPPEVRVIQADLAEVDVKPLLEGAAVVVHLAQADGPERDDDQGGAGWAGDAGRTRRPAQSGDQQGHRGHKLGHGASAAAG